MILGAAHDAFDGPEIGLLAVAIVGAVSSIITALIANRGRKHSQVVREQVENDHSDAKNPNLRVDLDDKHDEQRKQLTELKRGQDRLITDVHGIKADMGGMKEDVGLLKEGWRANRTDIDDLMTTESRRRAERAMWGPPPQTRRERRENRDAR